MPPDRTIRFSFHTKKICDIRALCFLQIKLQKIFFHGIDICNERNKFVINVLVLTCLPRIFET
jgi:hypothetical protein